MAEEKPPCALNPNHRYSIVKDGKLFDSGNCIHWARSTARREGAQLWHRGREGFSDMLVPLD